MSGRGGGGGEDTCGTAADVGLLRVIGLYRLLANSDGTARAVLKGVLWFTMVVMLLQPIGMYYTSNELQRFAFIASVVTVGLISAYKGYVLLNADRVLELLDIARYTFTASSARDSSRMRACGATLRVPLRAFAAFSYLSLVVYTVGVFAMDDYTPMVGPDGAVILYRTNIANMWFPVPVSVYNAAWPLFLLTEVIIYGTCMYVWVLFDVFLVTMCFAIHAQFRTVTDGFAALGHSRGQRGGPPTDFSDPMVSFEGIENDEEHLEHYNELILHIKDGQQIMKKLIEFMDIVRPAVLGHLMNSSNVLIFLTFLSVLAYTSSESSYNMMFFKMSTGVAMSIFQIYFYCYSFNHIEEAKSDMNFGVYSCDWTVMNLKFKKTLLMTMNLNSAHMRIMRFSPKSIVNLEMFAKVMNLTYSIVPVLLKAKSTKQ